MFEFFKKKKPAIPPEALCLWVHRQHHLSNLSALRERQGEAPFPFVRRVGVYDVVVALASNRGALAVSEEQLEAMHLSHEEAFVRATENAHERLQTVGQRDGVFLWEGFHAPAMLVMAPIFRAHLPLKGAPVLMLPNEQTALLAGADDPHALASMLELALDVHGSSEDFVSLRAVTWTDDKLPTEWFPEEDHPLADRFRAARSRTVMHEVEGLHHLHGAEAAPLAHLAPMPAEKGGQLIASWMREANVVLPAAVDRVVLIDTDDEPLPRVEVELATLLEIFPHAFEPIACGEDTEQPPEVDEAKLVRTRGVLFPTLGEKRFLVARQALLDAAPEAAELREVPTREVLAAWDAGDALIARPEGDDVLVVAADGRFAFVPTADFGDRMSTRPAADRQRFAQGHLVNALLSAMFAAADPDAVEDESTEDAAPAPPVEEFAPSTRPRLLSSNDLRRQREEGKEESLAEQLLQHALASAEPSKLFPVVRPPQYDEAQRRNELGMAQGLAVGEDVQIVHSSRVSRPGPEGLQFELVSDARDRVRPLDGNVFRDELAAMAWNTAMLNLKAASLSPPHQRGDGWYEGPWHDDFDASRLLLQPALARVCRVKGEPLVFAPTVGRTWVVGSEDVEAMGAVLDAIEAHLGSGDTTTPYQFRQLLFGWPWVVRGEQVERWAVPSTHPLSARIARLDEMLAKRRRDSMQHITNFARAASQPMQPRESEA